MNDKINCDIFRKIYTAGQIFTQPPVAAVAPNINSVKTYRKLKGISTRKRGFRSIFQVLVPYMLLFLVFVEKKIAVAIIELTPVPDNKGLRDYGFSLTNMPFLHLFSW